MCSVVGIWMPFASSSLMSIKIETTTSPNPKSPQYK